MDRVRITVDLDGAGVELARLAKGPITVVPKLEAALLAGMAADMARVHVITGFLKSTGHPSSTFDGSTWTGEQAFTRYPGIYELARGNAPTENHPEGGHYFFDPGGPMMEAAVRQTVWDFVTDGEGGAAPSEGLGPWSGGSGF